MKISYWAMLVAIAAASLDAVRAAQRGDRVGLSQAVGNLRKGVAALPDPATANLTAPAPNVSASTEEGFVIEQLEGFVASSKVRNLSRRRKPKAPTKPPTAATLANYGKNVFLADNWCLYNLYFDDITRAETRKIDKNRAGESVTRSDGVVFNVYYVKAWKLDPKTVASSRNEIIYVKVGLRSNGSADQAMQRILKGGTGLTAGRRLSV